MEHYVYGGCMLGKGPTEANSAEYMYAHVLLLSTDGLHAGIHENLKLDPWRHTMALDY